jgi:hypothetical protein
MFIIDAISCVTSVQHWDHINRRVKVRGACLPCWYWWNCWPSLFKLSIHVFRFSTKIYYFIMIRQNDFQIRIFGHVLKPVQPEADSMSGSMLLIWVEYRTLSKCPYTQSDSWWRRHTHLARSPRFILSQAFDTKKITYSQW